MTVWSDSMKSCPKNTWKPCMVNNSSIQNVINYRIFIKEMCRAMMLILKKCESTDFQMMKSGTQGQFPLSLRYPIVLQI